MQKCSPSQVISGLLDQVQPDSPRFTSVLLSEIQGFSRQFLQVSSDDERWSLVDCGLKEKDWEKILQWASLCPASQTPRPNSRAAGILLLLIGAAVGRSLEKDEPLWQMVAGACSDELRTALFGSKDYPNGQVRNAFSDACATLGLRHQLGLPGKHRYWRTVQLQFGFSAKAAAERLPFWLAGYGVPETVKSLLTEGDENGSQSFRQLWTRLKAWGSRPNDSAIENELRNNLWYPIESHGLLKAEIIAGPNRGIRSTIRIEDEEAICSLFGIPRFKDGAFQVGLSSFLPKEIASLAAVMLRLYVEGVGWSKLTLNEEGGRDLEGSQLRIGVWDALQIPVREISVVGSTGTLYKERFALWPDDEDVVLYRGEAGRQIRDLSRFTAESGCSYALVTRSDLQIYSNSGIVACTDQSDRWSLYNFPQGLPSGFQANLDGSLYWSPESKSIKPQTLPGSSFRIHELSVTSVDLSVQAPFGWIVEQFRFGGRCFSGDHVVMEISPIIEYSNKKARVLFVCGQERRTLDLQAERHGERCVGAAYQDAKGDWSILDPDAPLDAGLIEGRLLAVHWDELSAEDPWLTVGRQPLIAEPHYSRRQRFIATGERLQLRFGLMNEERASRVSLASALYSTGALAEIRETDDLYLLILRDKMEAAPDLRVWVWEDGCSKPRLLPKEEVEAHSDNQTLSLLKLSALNPIGWAVALEGNWRGARFNVDPLTENWAGLCKQWSAVLVREETWENCAAALRWWRFPVLMRPFRAIIQAQAALHEYKTLCAWIAPPLQAEMALSKTEGEYFVNPLRTLLWSYNPTNEECNQLWKIHQSCVLTAFEKGLLSDSTTLLLISHPVLLAKIICEFLWTRQSQEESQVSMRFERSLFCRVPNPVEIDAIERKYQQCFSVARDFIERQAGYSDPAHGSTKLQTLRAEALFELRSWTDSKPLDDSYFLENIIKPAEALFERRECSATRLKVAVTRSRACCAFIASHLLKTKGSKGTR